MSWHFLKKHSRLIFLTWLVKRSQQLVLYTIIKVHYVHVHVMGIWGLLGIHMTMGTEDATLPTSSSSCIIFLIRAYINEHYYMEPFR